MVHRCPQVIPHPSSARARYIHTPPVNLSAPSSSSARGLAGDRAGCRPRDAPARGEGRARRRPGPARPAWPRTRTPTCAAPPLQAALRCCWGSSAACVALAALSFSFVGLCTKLLGGALPPLQLTLLTSLLCWCPTTAALLAGRCCERAARRAPTGAAHHPASTAALLAARGVLGFANITCFFAAVQLMSLQEAVPLFYCSTVVALLLEAALQRQPVGCGALAGCLLSVGGVALIGRPGCHLRVWAARAWAAPACAGPPWGGGAAALAAGAAEAAHLPPLLLAHALPYAAGGGGCRAAGSGHSAGVALALAGALVNACQFLVVRRVGARLSPTALTWWYHSALAALSGLLLLGLGTPLRLGALDGRACGLVVAMAAATWLGQLLLTRGLQLGSATVASAINTSQVLYSFVWDAALLHTPVTLCGAGGAASIVAGVLAVCWQQGSRAGGWRGGPGPGGAERSGGADGWCGAEQQAPAGPLLLLQYAAGDEAGDVRLLLPDGIGAVVAVQDEGGEGDEVDELRQPLLGVQ